MRKRSISLLLVLLTLFSLFLTSCSEEEEEDETLTTVRSATYLTFYAITEKGTTDEAIKAVEKELNKYTSSLKTELVLRFYTEDKYEAALEDMFKLFKEEADAAAIKKAEEDKKKKEQQAYEKTLSAEEKRKLNQQRRLEAKEAERKAAQEEKERLERIEQGLEEPPEPITGAQMDVIYINGYDHYLSLIKGNEYFPNTSLLAPLDEYLKRDEKLITNYINPILLQAAKVNGATYGVPVNKAVGKAQYFVYNTKLLEKYEYDVSDITNLFPLEEILAEIKEKEPNVIPMVAPTTVPGFDFFGEEGSAIVVDSPEHTVFKADGASSTFKTYSIKAHFERMANFRKLGYFKDSYPSSVKEFFLEIREGSAEDAKKWQEEGYTVTLYKAAKADNETTLSGLFGISSKSKIVARAAEVLTLIYTNANFSTALKYGVEGTHYVLDDDGYVEVISDDYKMDFFKTGNTFIGKTTPEYKDYRAMGIENNKNLKVYGFMGYTDSKLTEDDLDIIAKANKIVKGKYAQLCKGVENWEEIYNEVVNELDAIGFSVFIADKFNSDFAAALKANTDFDDARNAEKPDYFKPDPNATVEGEEGTEAAA